MSRVNAVTALSSFIDSSFEPLAPVEIDGLARAYRLYIQVLADRERADFCRLAG